MIANETEYQEATTRLQGERERAVALAKDLKGQGKAAEEIKACRPFAMTRRS